MTKKEDLRNWVRDALKSAGGKASIVDIAKAIWILHEVDLKTAGDLFYTWQYDMRWAANSLRRRGVLKDVSLSPRGVWELV